MNRNRTALWRPMSTEAAEPMIALKILYSRLENLYRTRQFGPDTLRVAKQLLESCFRKHRDSNQDLTPQDCQMLAGAIEVVDYFEIQAWGTGESQSDELY